MIRKWLSELSSRSRTINRNSRGAHWPSPVKEPSSKELQWKWSESESHSVVSDSLRPHGLYTVHEILHARILEWVVHSRGSSQPRDQTQVYPHCRQILYQLSHKGSPRILKWVAYPLSSGSSDPRIKRVSCITGRLFTNRAMREALSSAMDCVNTASGKAHWYRTWNLELVWPEFWSRPCHLLCFEALCFIFLICEVEIIVFSS